MTRHLPAIAVAATYLLVAWAVLGGFALKGA